MAERRALIAALFLISLGGLLLHYRIHPFLIPDKANPAILIFSGTKLVASLLSFVDVVIVPLLFLSRRTALYGYLLNGLLVIYGSVLMAHFSIAGLAGKTFPVSELILRSTLPDIAIAWTDFFIGKALYDSYMNAPVSQSA
ncbi:MAG TPA: hypothetical protein VK445_06955 [Dissulfurispiraceae bacterium]|nr:hypothetical protein [Dissulfurispiraceae bacterium]